MTNSSLVVAMRPSISTEPSRVPTCHMASVPTALAKSPATKTPEEVATAHSRKGNGEDDPGDQRQRHERDVCSEVLLWLISLGSRAVRTHRHRRPWRQSPPEHAEGSTAQQTRHHSRDDQSTIPTTRAAVTGRSVCPGRYPVALHGRSS